MAAKGYTSSVNRQDRYNDRYLADVASDAMGRFQEMRPGMRMDSIIHNELD